jgi:biopolymer transport protein ExbD
MLAFVVAVVVMLAACMSPVMQFGAGKSRTQAQRDTMREFTPSRLVADATWTGPVETRKIRVHADNQYRAQNVHWQKTFEESLEIANLIMKPLFGLALVAEYHSWERHVAGSTLEDDLGALEALDPGTDVIAVIGLTSSLALASATFDSIGLATVGGRHIMLRGYADLAERKVFEAAFAELRADEREAALNQLREHKTAVTLLHELGHNLGLGHAAEEDSIMSAVYSHRAGPFQGEVRAQMLQQIDQRLGRARHDEATLALQPAAAPGPATPSRPKGPAHAPIVIRVTGTGAAIVDGKTLDVFALSQLFDEAFQADAETMIVIHSDKHVPVGAVSDVIDRAKAIGLQKFSLGTSGL